MKKKAWILLIVFGLSCFSANAEESDRFFTIRDFSKGLNSQSSPYVVPENQGTVYKNIRPNRTFGGIGKRSTNLLYGDCGSAEVTSLHRYYQSDGDKFSITTASTNVYQVSDTDGTCTTIGNGFTDGRRFQWVTYKNNAIGMNGVEKSIKWDGKTETTTNTDSTRTASDLVAELGAPFAELNTGSNLDASSWYAYKVAFTDGTNYYYSDARSNPINTGSSVRDVTLTDIPLGPAGTTARYVFRSEGKASRAAVVALANSAYKLADTIANNTATTYNDAIADGSLTTVYSTWISGNSAESVTPPIGKYGSIHREKLFVAGNSTYPSDIYWSENFLPDYFNSTSYQQVRPDDGDQITFIKDFLGILTIGKTNTIQKLYTDAAQENWSLSAPFSFVGCPAPYSVANSPIGIIYLARDGIYRFGGQTSEFISDAVTQEVDDILQSNIERAAGFFNNGEYHLAYTSQSAGGTANNRVLVYDMTRDAYSLDTKNVNVFEAFDAGNDFGTLYHGSSKADGKIYADEGSPSFISARLKSEFDLGTYDDARAIGDEDSPMLEISWDLTLDGASGTLNTHSYGATAIIDRPDTNGTWTSQIYNINAESLTQLQWHERLNGAGDITFQVRSASTEAGITGASWSSAVTNPNGSDLTGLTANDFIQVRANLSTSDITITPNLYVDENYGWKLFYLEEGSSAEPDFTSEWTSGWLSFGNTGNKKLIRRIKIYYTGTTGTLHFNYENDEKDVARDFDIDLSVDGEDSEDDFYEGGEIYKVYTYRPGENEESDNGPTGELWKFNITEVGVEDWQVFAIEIMYNLEEVYD